jgi:ComF family protein
MRAVDHLTACAADGGPRAAPARRSLRARIAAAARSALPQRCTLCCARADDALVCAACEAAMPRIAAPCPMCALPSTHASVCGACLARPPPFAAAVAAYAYAFPVDRLLQALKYGGRLALADWAAGALAAAVVSGSSSPQHALDAIVALPLAPPRQRERGFNQSDEIARRIAARVGVPFVRALVRTRGGVAQATLPWAARAANVRGAFACVRDVRGLRLALVDDVMTTGATIGDATRALARAGALRIDAWVVARTPIA